VFQPHRYTRTRDLLLELGRAFDDAEVVFVLPVHPAGEAPIEGADRDALVHALRGQGHRDVRALPGLDAALERVPEALRSGDLVIALGAGDVGRLGRALVARLGEAPDAPGGRSEIAGRGGRQVD
jgi:UDP-N-acetylmuramate--alanine ligase